MMLLLPTNGVRRTVSTQHDTKCDKLTACPAPCRLIRAYWDSTWQCKVDSTTAQILLDTVSAVNVRMKLLIDFLLSLLYSLECQLVLMWFVQAMFTGWLRMKSQLEMFGLVNLWCAISHGCCSLYCQCQLLCLDQMVLISLLISQQDQLSINSISVFVKAVFCFVLHCTRHCYLVWQADYGSFECRF